MITRSYMYHSRVRTGKAGHRTSWLNCLVQDVCCSRESMHPTPTPPPHLTPPRVYSTPFGIYTAQRHIEYTASGCRLAFNLSCGTHFARGGRGKGGLACVCVGCILFTRIPLLLSLAHYSQPAPGEAPGRDKELDTGCNPPSLLHSAPHVVFV